MITFNEFLEHKRVESVVTECAYLMVELDVEPYEYIYESLKKVDPVLAEGWWDGVKDMAGRAWNAAKQVGKSVWDGGGLKHGIKQASDTVAGPVAKFDAVERALTDLVNILNKDERFQNFQSKSGQGSVGKYLAKVLEDLKVDKSRVPQLMQTQVAQNYGTRRDAEAEQKAQRPSAMDMSKLGQKPQPKPAMDMSKLSAG